MNPAMAVRREVALAHRRTVVGRTIFLEAGLARTHRVTIREASPGMMVPKMFMGSQSRRKFEASTTRCLPRMHCGCSSTRVPKWIDWRAEVFREIFLTVTNHWLDEQSSNSNGSSRFRAPAAKDGGIGMFKPRRMGSSANHWRVLTFRSISASTA
jgi:hypothetical protein